MRVANRLGGLAVMIALAPATLAAAVVLLAFAALPVMAVDVHAESPAFVVSGVGGRTDSAAAEAIVSRGGTVADLAVASPTNMHILPPTNLEDVSCSACHALPRGLASRADVLPSTRDACLTCHTDQRQQLEALSTHPPFVSGECTSCHQAHPSTDGGYPVLKVAAAELCVSCHADKRQLQETSAFRHAPFATGQCTSCHSGHASSSAPVLKAPVGELCLSCHQRVAQKLSAAEVHPPFQTGNCTWCHTPHASDQPAELRSSVHQVCLSCHAGQQTSMDAAHKPVRQGWCTDCHEPHASNHEPLLAVDRNELCFTCHRK